MSDGVSTDALVGLSIATAVPGLWCVFCPPVLDAGAHRKVPQVGNVVIGDDVEASLNRFFEILIKTHVEAGSSSRISGWSFSATEAAIAISSLARFSDFPKTWATL